jgi:hypothetical protein
MQRLMLLPFLLLSQAHLGLHAADLAAAIAPDLAAAELHIISATAAYVTQTGNNNMALISQEGSTFGNFSNIGQVGNNNYAIAVQNGDLNFVNIQQLGNDNNANSAQSGFSNAISLTQLNDANQFNGVQQGSNNTFNAIQNGNSMVNMQAQGNGNNISADMPAGKNYTINIVGDNINASSVGQ